MNDTDDTSDKFKPHSVIGCLIGFAMIGAGVYSILHPIMIFMIARSSESTVPATRNLAGLCGDGTMIGLFVGAISGVAFAIVMNHRNQRKHP